MNSDINQFLKNLVDEDRSKNTVAAYAADLNKFSAWFRQTNGYELSRENITYADAREYKQFMVILGYSASTINRKLAAVRAFANWCSTPVMVRGVIEQTAAPRWLDRQEIGKLTRQLERGVTSARSEIAKTRAIRDRAIVMAMLHTGLRVSEICGLDISHLSISERSGSATVMGKGQKYRVVPVNATARAVLRDWLPLRPENSSVVFDVHPRQVEKMLARISRWAGINCTPHTLRHTFAKSLIDAGVSIDRVAALLGHRSLDTTKLYIIPSQQDLSKAVDLLD